MTARERTSYFNVRMPMPPPLNDQLIVSKTTKRPILSKAARIYKREAAAPVRAQLRMTPWEDIGGPLKITMYQWHATEQQLNASDWDGRVKILQDVLCKCLGINDNRITLAIVDRCGVSDLDAYVDVELMPR